MHFLRMKNALIRGSFVIPLQSCNSVTHVYQDTKVNWKLYGVFTYEDFTLVRKNTENNQKLNTLLIIKTLLFNSVTELQQLLAVKK